MQSFTAVFHISILVTALLDTPNLNHHDCIPDLDLYPNLISNPKTYTVLTFKRSFEEARTRKSLRV